MSNKNDEYTAEKAVDCIKNLYKEGKKDSNSRYWSWNHCYNVFQKILGKKTKEHWTFYVSIWRFIWQVGACCVEGLFYCRKIIKYI